MIDSDFALYTEVLLQQWKADAEERAHQILSAGVGSLDAPLGQRDGATRISFPDRAGMFPLTRLRSGSDVWNVVDGAHRYFLEDLEDTASDDELDCSASFLQNAKDWGELSADVTEAGMRAVRDAKRSLTTDLNALRARGLVVLGGTRHGVVRGGVLPPGRWSDALLIVTSGDDERVDTLCWVVPHLEAQQLHAMRVDGR